MEIVLCIVLGIWTLISGAAVVYRVFKDYGNVMNKEKGENK